MSFVSNVSETRSPIRKKRRGESDSNLIGTVIDVRSRRHLENKEIEYFVKYKSRDLEDAWLPGSKLQHAKINKYVAFNDPIEDDGAISIKSRNMRLGDGNYWYTIVWENGVESGPHPLRELRPATRALVAQAFGPQACSTDSEASSLDEEASAMSKDSDSDSNIQIQLETGAEDPAPIEPDPAPIEPASAPLKPAPAPIEPSPLSLESDSAPLEPDPVLVTQAFGPKCSETESEANAHGKDSVSGIDTRKVRIEAEADDPIPDQPNTAPDQLETTLDQSNTIPDQPDPPPDQPNPASDQPEPPPDQPDPTLNQPEPAPDQPAPDPDQSAPHETETEKIRWQRWLVDSMKKWKNDIDLDYAKNHPDGRGPKRELSARYRQLQNEEGRLKKLIDKHNEENKKKIAAKQQLQEKRKRETDDFSVIKQAMQSALEDLKEAENEKNRLVEEGMEESAAYKTVFNNLHNKLVEAGN